MSRFLNIIVCFTLGILLLPSCQPEKEEYTLTVLSANDQQGTVKGGGTYEEGEEVSIQAFGIQGFHFVRWNDQNTDNPRNILVDKNLTYTAYFSSDTLRGAISSNTTLSDIGRGIDYIIDGELRIEGAACLTIEPGVTITFTDSTGGIYVTDEAALKMEGTIEKNIIFRGNSNEKGGWNAIRYASKRSENVMKHVVLSNGGSQGYILDLGNSKVAIEDCTFDGSLGYGITGGNPSLIHFTRNTICNCDKSPIFFASFTPFQNIGEGNTYKNNKENLLVVNGSNQMIFENLTIKRQSIPYHLKGGSLLVQESATLTLQPGVQILFDARGSIQTKGAGKLIAEGSEKEPIKLGAYKENNGWEGIAFHSDKSCVIAFCEVSNASDYGIVVDNTAHIRIQDITLSNCSFGLNIMDPYNRFMSLTAERITFSNCVKGNIYYEYLDQIEETLPSGYPLEYQWEEE